MDYLSAYESMLSDMSTWIATQTWGGHESGCPAFAGKNGECNCIESVRVEWHKTRRLREIEVLHAIASDGGDKYTAELVEENLFLKEKLLKAQALPEFAVLMLDIQAANTKLVGDLKEARYRVGDMLRGDDGQAWQEARKFEEKMEAKHGAIT